MPGAPDSQPARVLPGRLYAIVDTKLAAGPATTAAERLLKAGVRILQYRHKGAFGQANWEECRQISQWARECQALFFVNDRVDVAVLCGATGVHLGQNDLPPAEARRLAGDAVWLGFSTHDLEQAREADHAPVDYLAIGPVFPTASKENPDPVVGLQTVTVVKQATRKPLVAIGGITLHNARSVLDAGADAVAVIRDLMAGGPGDIEARAREFLARLS